MVSRNELRTALIAVIVDELNDEEENERQKKTTRRRRWWVREINRRRNEQGDFTNLVHELRNDEEQFFVYFRMSPSTFDRLFSLVGPSLRRLDTHLRKSVTPSERLAITLRRLATGDSPQSVAFAYRRGLSTVHDIVYETSEILWKVLVPLYMKPPSERDDWMKIENGFSSVWNFPNCIGALDGKHVGIQAPRNSGSTFFNYKHFHSVVLMAMCDAHYQFMYVDIGEAGRWSDSGVFENTQFGSAFLNGKVPLPPCKPLFPGGESMPHCIVADEASPLKTWMMRPYPGKSLDTLEKKVFNYRLSRARRTIENTFGIMVVKWRILKSSIIAEPTNVVKMVKAICVLHNFLRQTDSAAYMPPGLTDVVDSNGNITDGSWRSEAGGSTLTSFNSHSRNHTQAAFQVRDKFAEFFTSDAGELAWQTDYVSRTR